MQISALLVLVNFFRIKIVFKKKGKDFKKNFGRKMRGPVPTLRFHTATVGWVDADWGSMDRI